MFIHPKQPICHKWSEVNQLWDNCSWVFAIFESFSTLLVLSLAKLPLPHQFACAFMTNPCLLASTLDFLLTWCNLAVSNPHFAFSLNTPLGSLLTMEHFSKALCRLCFFLTLPGRRFHVSAAWKSTCRDLELVWVRWSVTVNKRHVCFCYVTVVWFRLFTSIFIHV